MLRFHLHIQILSLSISEWTQSFTYSVSAFMILVLDWYNKPRTFMLRLIVLENSLLRLDPQSRKFFFCSRCDSSIKNKQTKIIKWSAVSVQITTHTHRALSLSFPMQLYPRHDNLNWRRRDCHNHSENEPKPTRTPECWDTKRGLHNQGRYHQNNVHWL